MKKFLARRLFSGVSKSVSTIKKQIQKNNRLKKSTNRFSHNSRCDPIAPVQISIQSIIGQFRDSRLLVIQGHVIEFFYLYYVPRFNGLKKACQACFINCAWLPHWFVIFIHKLSSYAFRIVRMVYHKPRGF